MDKNFIITILTDKSSWMNEYNLLLKEKLCSLGHSVNIINSKENIVKGNIAFFLSCFEIVPQKYLDLNENNIVVHASDLPNGKGWSPTTWQILENKKRIPLTLFEATTSVDAGDIYIKDELILNGYELINEWQRKLALKIVDMCLKYVINYHNIVGIKQIGNESFYRKRTPDDSELDINKTIKEQFNLLRVVDNDKYPAFFEIDSKRYYIKIFEG